MKLGLLHKIPSQVAALREQPNFASFEHKTLQEFSAGRNYIAPILEEAEDVQARFGNLLPTAI